MAFIREGKKARIVDIFGGRGIVRRLMEIGLSPGSEVMVIRNSLGPMIIEVRGVRLALGRGLASKILVEPLS
ncbi:MAG TPA: ferrous iron transport protein A [Candidatus Korarchaeota archaeon]|nr:ferrous iron transport protein A [Candidatus Korarchaeota archaeon]